MEWINDLRGKTVGLDTAPLIYFIEENPAYIEAAQLRATHNIRTPDAIQISAALNAGATHFFTNDIILPEIPSIQILSIDALV